MHRLTGSPMIHYTDRELRMFYEMYQEQHHVKLCRGIKSIKYFVLNDEGSRFDQTIREPFEKMPLRINDQDEDARLAARWRLRIEK